MDFEIVTRCMQKTEDRRGEEFKKLSYSLSQDGVKKVRKKQIKVQGFMQTEIQVR